jgi:hypothetical protein
MDKIIRDTQLKLLGVFSKRKTSFSLAGGTALELCYLKHRFSRDLDFFSKKYNISEIDNIINTFNKHLPEPLHLDKEFEVSGKAKVRLYSAELNRKIPLKIDFVEDVIVENPKIKEITGIRVYDVKDIYLQKISTIIGAYTTIDETGREAPSGRNEPRDVFDIYCISREILPLHEFMAKLSESQKRRTIQWYRSYSRHEVKLGLLDLEIYDKKFDSNKMIRHIDKEIKKFIMEETV